MSVHDRLRGAPGRMENMIRENARMQKRIGELEAEVERLEAVAIDPALVERIKDCYEMTGLHVLRDLLAALEAKP